MLPSVASEQHLELLALGFFFDRNCAAKDPQEYIAKQNRDRLQGVEVGSDGAARLDLLQNHS